MNKYLLKSIEQFPSYQLLTLTPNTENNTLHYWPGQYAAIGFKQGGFLSPMRCFSMVSSPHSNELQFAMRKSGRFTRKISKLDIGSQIIVQGPFGNFVQDPSDNQIILLAAGIGITPFMSMIRHAAETNSSTPTTLIYACRSERDIPFRDELRYLKSRLPNLRLLFVLSDGVSDPNQNIYVGRVDERLLDKITSGRFNLFTYFMCGPKSFTNSMETILGSKDIDENRIVTESFTQATRLGWDLRKPSVASLTYAFTGLLMLAGIGFIMSLDLVRYVPKSIKTANTASNTTTVTPTAATTPSYSTDDNSANTQTSNTSTSTTTPSTTPTTTTYSQVYQPPVSAVS